MADLEYLTLQNEEVSARKKLTSKKTRYMLS